MSGMWLPGPSLTASFCFQKVNLSSLRLSLSFTFCYNLKQERESAGRGEKRQEEVIRKILLLPSSHLLSSLDSRPVSKERTERGPKVGRGVLANTIYLDNELGNFAY